MTDDALSLARFLHAQEPVLASVLDELRAGRKTGHWMWFVFPQIEGLGSSPTARHYALRSLAEARAYLAHPVLGPRLRQCVETVTAVRTRSAAAIFGSPDDMKLRSSLTLFVEAAPDEAVFQRGLDRFFSGEADPLTLARLRSQAGS